MSPVVCASDEPEAEPDVVPSAPPLDRSEDGLRRPLPFNPELVTDHVRQYLRSAEGRAVIESVAKRALLAELRGAEERLRTARANEEAAFKSQAKRAATDAAAEAVRGEAQQLHGLVEAIAATAVRREAERAVPMTVRDDPLMRRILSEQLERVRMEVRNAAEKELETICNEDRYHRVNGAFLAALERRSQEAIARTQQEVERTLQQAHRPVFMAQALGVAALVVAVAGFFVPRARL